MAKHRKKITSKPNRAKRPKGPSCGERVRLMKKNFMELHEAGCTVQKIARMYELGESTVYDALEEIAAANNVPRESLLWKVKRNTNTETHKATPEVVVQEAEQEPVPEVVPKEEKKTPTPEVVLQPKPEVGEAVIQSDCKVQLPPFETVEREHKETQQVLSGLLEVVTQLDDTLAEVLKEEKRYA